MTQDQRAAFEAQIELPPFPEEKVRSARSFTPQALVMLANDVEAYARQAIAHDRQRQADWHQIADDRAAEIVRLEGLLDQQQRKPEVTDDMRMAVRFAPFSDHWSKVLADIFGPDARDGIATLEKQLREAMQHRVEPAIPPPSDQQIIQTMLGFGTHVHGDRTATFTGAGLLAGCRALLARYGNAAPPAASIEPTVDGFVIEKGKRRAFRIIDGKRVLL